MSHSAATDGRPTACQKPARRRESHRRRCLHQQRDARGSAMSASSVRTPATYARPPRPPRGFQSPRMRMKGVDSFAARSIYCRISPSTTSRFSGYLAAAGGQAGDLQVQRGSFARVLSICRSVNGEAVTARMFWPSRGSRCRRSESPWPSSRCPSAEFGAAQGGKRNLHSDALPLILQASGKKKNSVLP